MDQLKSRSQLARFPRPFFKSNRIESNLPTAGFPPHLLASVLALLASANTILASTLELAIGELDEDSDPLSSDIGLALTLLYLPALLANFYTLRAVLKERDAAPTA